MDDTQSLASLTNFPTFATPMGKGSVNETLPNYGGIYGGIGSYPQVREVVESSDAILWIGRYPVSHIFNSSL